MAFDSSYSLSEVKAAGVSRNGVLLDTAVYLRHDPTVSQEGPSVAFGDTCFLATWTEWTSHSDIYTARVSPSAGDRPDRCTVERQPGQ